MCCADIFYFSFFIFIKINVQSKCFNEFVAYELISPKLIN
nr:MAG TPA: hypothetical protein [Caudoviricetes sp.]